MSLKFRRHFKLVVLLMLMSAVLILGFGDQRITAYTVQSDEQTVEIGIGNQVTLFDGAVANSAESLISETGWLELSAH